MSQLHGGRKASKCGADQSWGGLVVRELPLKPEGRGFKSYECY